MTCLVINLSNDTVRHAASVANAKSIYASAALESGQLFFAETAEELGRVSLDDLMYIWRRTRAQYYAKIGKDMPKTDTVNPERYGKDATLSTLFKAWKVTYPVHDIWDGEPVVDADMNVVAKNERTARLPKPKPKRVSKAGPWTLNKDAEMLFRAETHKQRRVIGARIVAATGEGEAFTRATAVEACKQAHEAGEYRVSAGTLALGGDMADQIWDWHVNPLVKAGIIIAVDK